MLFEMKSINKFLMEYAIIHDHTIEYDKGNIADIRPLKFVNRPFWCKHGIMSSSVIDSHPIWNILVRGIPHKDSDLNSHIGVARGINLDKLQLDDEPLITPAKEWDSVSAEDPTYCKDRLGFYYSGVTGEAGDRKCNLCFSDMKGNTKLIIPHGKNMDMIKELEKHRGKYFSEIGNDYSYIAQVKDNQIVPFLEPTENTWYDSHTSPGPISKRGTMFFNGSTNGGKEWAIGKLSVNDGSVLTSKPIIKCSGNICFASDLKGKLLFFHFKDKIPCVARLIRR